MASSSSTQKLKLTKTNKGYLHNDKEAIKTYVNYVENAKVNTGAFTVLAVFPLMNLHHPFKKMKS